MIAILLSIIFPGLGQIYYGKVFRGLLMIALCFIPFVYPLILVWSIYDCIQLKKKIKPDPMMRREAIVVIILGLVVIPVFSYLMIFGSYKLFTNYSDKVIKHKGTHSEMVEISGSLDNYRRSNGVYPADLESLIGNNPVRKSWLYDAWNRKYKYLLSEEDEYLLVSAGRDGSFMTEDDLIISFNKERNLPGSIHSD